MFSAVVLATVLVTLFAQTGGNRLREPKQLTAAVGESVVLNCEVEFPHDVFVPYILRWNKEGKQTFAWDGPEQIYAASSYKGRVSRLESDGTGNLGRGAVNLTSIRESDEGWYECQVFFPNRSPPTRSNGGKLLAIPPINQTVKEGESARFRCVAKHAGDRVTWFRDGVLLEDIPGLWARSTVDTEGSLNISRTEHNDPGLFRCEVTNDEGEKQAAGAHLNAKVVHAPLEQFLAFGRHGRLDCHFRANPPLKYLRWEKDGFLFDPYNVPGVFLLHNGSLSFEHVDESHAGVYTCAPFNELGSAGSSSPMTVLVQRPPVFTLRPASLYVRRVDDGVDMACAAVEEGNHEDARPPTVSWVRKDGGDLPIGRHVLSSGNLTMRGLKSEDSGVYLCTASNEAARLVAETELLVEETASKAPHSLAANSSHDAIALKWTPGARGPEEQTTVWYRRSDVPEWYSMRVAANAREAVLAPLKPGSLYEVMVSSRDADGEGMISRPLRIHTKGAAMKEEVSKQVDASVAAGSPGNVSIQSLGSSWLVTWAPPERPARGRLTYTVRWWQLETTDGDAESEQADNWEPRGGSVETDDNWLLVRGLEDGATYVFEVEARGGGSGRASLRVDLGPKVRSSARAVVLAALVAVILLIAVAVASWHVYDALVSRLQPPSLGAGDNVWVAPNTLITTTSSTTASGAANYPRDSFD
ncbi:hypothetical protein B566_EDAN009070 [Ephemera danica]|nr:hypothetical protein B566_EDAN009070 [Ephemera danica]